eukprot:gene11710-8057_t
MFRRTARRFLGYTPVNPDTSPMVQYSNYHWHYNFPQGMERPHNVNRSLPAPFQSSHRNVNRYRSVWIGDEGPSAGLPVVATSSGTPLQLGRMPMAYAVALEPYLKKLPHGRNVPSTPVAEAVTDFETVQGRVEDELVREVWLSKLLHHCAHAREAETAMQLWEKYAAPKYMPATTSPGATAAVPPPLQLVKAALFACSKGDHKGWRGIFNMCLKSGWNYSPYFDTAQWSFLLKSLGRQGDEAGVKAVLEEMLDVKADLDRVEARSLVFALNCVKDNEIYNFVKQFLFHFSERKVKHLRLTYSDLRGHGAGKLRVPLNPELNDAMYYHVCWHESVRLPRRFSPRQLYFDYHPSTTLGGIQDPDAKIDDIVKDKIEKWKSEGLLPEDYVHEDRVYDRGTAFKNVARQEKWKKMPKIVKSRKFGYTGD